MSKSITYLIPLLLIMGCEAQDNASIPKTQATFAEPSPTPSPSASPTPPPVVQATNCSISGLGVLAANSMVSNNPRVDYPASNVIDNNTATFMTTNGLSLGQSITLAFEFTSPVFLDCLKFSNDFNNGYYFGDMEIHVSSDSTNGSNGNWDYVSTMTSATTYFFSGDGNISVSKPNVKWVMVKMTYNGTGASGGTPSFYFSEIGFHGN